MFAVPQRRSLAGLRVPMESVVWHYVSPGLLKGLGICCNAIVLDGIGPCTDTDDTFLIEFGVIIALLEAIHGDGHVWRRSGFQVEVCTTSV